MKPDLDAIRARCEAATPGPWGYRNHDKRYLLDDTTDVVGEVNPGKTSAAITVFSVASGALEDAAFLAHARTDIPALLAYIDEMERLNGINNRIIVGLLSAIESMSKVDASDDDDES